MFLRPAKHVKNIVENPSLTLARRLNDAFSHHQYLKQRSLPPAFIPPQAYRDPQDANDAYLKQAQSKEHAEAQETAKKNLFKLEAALLK